MAITSAEIHNQSFSIDRKGYDVDEVDVFLEHVADEIDGMNAQIAQLENQLDDRKFEGFDTPARVEAPVVVTDDAALAEKDARIADLERQLEAKKADDNAIAQALIIAQRPAVESIANANAQAAATIKDAEDEGTRIVDKAEAERQKVLDGEDLSATIEGMVHYVIDTEVEDAFAGADHCDDPEKLAQINAKFEGVYYPKGAFAPQPGLSRDEAKEQLYPLFRQTYAAREQEFGAERMREIERIILLRVVDEYWMDNIDAMEDLKQGIRLRAYGQTDPVVAYKREGFAMFDGMINAIREETVRRLYLFRLRTEEDIRRKQVAKITATGGAAGKTVKHQPARKSEIGGSDPCPCGSGKKPKYCGRAAGAAAS